MKALALCLVVLIATCNATSLFDRFPIKMGGSRSIMTVLTQVQNMLQNGGPLDAITTMLNEFVTAITEEQAAHDQLWAEQQRECAREFAFREAEVNAAVAALKEGQATLQGCVSQKVRAKQDHEITSNQLAATRNFLAALINVRNKEAYAFETTFTAYNLTKDAIRVGLEILEEIWSGESATSFVQLASHMNTLAVHATKLRKTHLLVGVMSAMAQLASKDLQADEALLDRVKQMFVTFREKIEAEFQIAAAAENSAIEEYKRQRLNYEATISRLAEQKANLEEELQKLEKCIVVQTGIVNSATGKRDRNQRLWDDAKSLCDSCEHEYFSAKEARNEELELLSQIKERVEARFGQMSEGVKERGMEDEFKNEQNYQYKQPEFQSSH